MDDGREERNREKLSVCERERDKKKGVSVLQPIGLINQQS